MEGFDLVPLDGGEPVRLPEGETVLGRGPFLGVNDKRVSRHHSLLENQDGQLRLKPTHVNPCFSQACLEDAPQPLERDRWHILHHGDIFSLLPGKYIYKVVALGGRNSQAFQGDGEEYVPTRPSGSASPKSEPPPPIKQDICQTLPWTGEDMCQTPCPVGQHLTGTRRSQNAALEVAVNQQKYKEEIIKTCTSDKGETGLVKEVQRPQNEVCSAKKRVLPAWMTASVASPVNPCTTSKGAGRTSKGPAMPTTSSKRGSPPQSTCPVTSVGEESESSGAEQMLTKRRKMRKAQSEAVPRARQQARRASESEEFDSLDAEESENGTGDRKGNKLANPTAGINQPDKQDRKSEDELTDDRAKRLGTDHCSASNQTPSKALLRKPCPYGKDCYRKNPLHFQECSHPGDSDYKEEKEDEAEAADLPECPYGTDCYRKNPLHLKEYKHTKRPARTTRKQGKKSPADDDDDGDDFGDSDSFINDESDDNVDDSDYVPPDSDESGKEDIKQLQKEAKAFMKRNK
ncbi:aprataxin and PNK-like factor [Lampris incognitus]|uniref:aprataxin and PNK-like factor n=1 Tax=Lampris incognitus TaxID=2546036 RepID=UPI0024B5EF8F|nr:aprataxin and PNK-like factor [Lampris incognitus]